MALLKTQHVTNAPMNVAVSAIIVRQTALEVAIQAVYSGAATAEGTWSIEGTCNYTGNPATTDWSDASSGLTLPTVSGGGDFMIVFGGQLPFPGDAVRLTFTPTPSGTTTSSDLLNVYVTRLVQ